MHRLVGTRLACGAAALLVGWPVGAAVAADERPHGQGAAQASANAGERSGNANGAGQAASGQPKGSGPAAGASAPEKAAQKQEQKKAEQAQKQADKKAQQAQKQADKKAQQALKQEQKKAEQAEKKAQQAQKQEQKPVQQASPQNGAQQGASGNKPTGSASGAGDPHGNNGTVKIAPLGELDRIPNNTPHPGCTFQVEWYGFDGGDDVVSTVTFAMMPPTADTVLSVDGPTQVPVGGDAASGAGTQSGLDARQAYTLSFDGEPHPKQGYHVRLTVQTPRSLGNDTKTKVFWVEPCESAPTPVPAGGAPLTPQAGLPGASTPNAGAPGTSVPGAGGTPVPLTADGETADSSTALTGEVAGTSAHLEGVERDGATSADVPTSVAAGTEQGWLESRSTWSLLSLGLLLLGAAAAGGGLLLRLRRSA